MQIIRYRYLLYETLNVESINHLMEVHIYVYIYILRNVLQSIDFKIIHWVCICFDDNFSHWKSTFANTNLQMIQIMTIFWYQGGFIFCSSTINSNTSWNAGNMRIGLFEYFAHAKHFKALIIFPIDPSCNRRLAKDKLLHWIFEARDNNNTLVCSVFRVFLYKFKILKLIVGNMI